MDLGGSAALELRDRYGGAAIVMRGRGQGGVEEDALLVRDAPGLQMDRMMAMRFANVVIRASLLAAAFLFALSLSLCSRAQGGKAHPFFETLTDRMDVDVDGAPNGYGPPGVEALDLLLNGHYLNRADKEIVGYLIDEHGRPILQGRGLCPSGLFQPVGRIQPSKPRFLRNWLGVRAG